MSRKPFQTQRSQKEQLSEERRRRLDELGFVWDPFKQQWEEGFSRLRAYVEEHGDCLVPVELITSDGYHLGSWSRKQRSQKEQLSEERRGRLDELGFVWDPFKQQWEEGFSHLQAYVEEHGDCLVPASFKSGDGYRLGQWVGVQRSQKEQLSEERRGRLDELGFVWDPFKQQWEEGFSRLRAYVEEHGDCLVPVELITSDGYHLGSWSRKQRSQKEQLSEERRGRLDELGFVWDPFKQQWEEGFSHLQAYVEEYGDCLVRQSFRTSDGYHLGSWVNKQRSKKEQLSEERRGRLDELGFVWDRRQQRWEEGFSHLQAYVEEHGDCRVPNRFRTSDGYHLGSWVNKQRSKKEQLSEERRGRLDELGFVWDRRQQRWEEGFSHLQAYAEEHGDCRVPASFKSGDGYRLGQWVGVQRSKKEQMSRERRGRLDELGFDWDPFKQQWEEGFSHLQAYAKEHGDCLVPNSFKTSDGYFLRFWVNTQRSGKEQLSPECRGRLDELGFDWDPFKQKWEEGFRHLQAYAKEHGDCRVPNSFKTSDGYHLGSWVNTQRSKKEQLSEERRGRLDELGFDWDRHRQQWEEGFSHLQAYAEEHGHCLVPNRFITSDGHRLGTWVSRQRPHKEQMLPERRRRLDELGFDWDRHRQQWEEGFSHLQAYAEEHGHCLVPNRFITSDGHRLGTWVSRQRPHKEQMLPERRDRLDALGFVWNTKSTTGQ